jgi:hypothetical protein
LDTAATAANVPALTVAFKNERRFMADRQTHVALFVPFRKGKRIVSPEWLQRRDESAILSRLMKRRESAFAPGKELSFDESTPEGTENAMRRRDVVQALGVAADVAAAPAGASDSKPGLDLSWASGGRDFESRFTLNGALLVMGPTRFTSSSGSWRSPWSRLLGVV